ncbi:MAG: hypothetical protein CMJ40_06940 [Phycisphaerae bacterium]|nr:hypothetical protein [Phycisphaerae bacterium]
MMVCMGQPHSVGHQCSSRLDLIIERGIGLARPTVADLASVWSKTRAVRTCVRCGQRLGPGEETASGCGGCRAKGGILDGVITLGPFEGLLADGIRALKYRGRWELAEVLGGHLANAVEAFFADSLHSGDWVLVPMPMPFWRKVERGLDHAHLLARSCATRLGMKVIQPLRKAPCLPQASLSRTDRERAKKGDYRIRRRGTSGFGGKLPNLKGKSVILVDDVLTTGRSMSAAGSALKRLGPASVHAAALAVSTNRSPD